MLPTVSYTHLSLQQRSKEEIHFQPSTKRLGRHKGGQPSTIMMASGSGHPSSSWLRRLSQSGLSTNIQWTHQAANHKIVHSSVSIWWWLISVLWCVFGKVSGSPFQHVSFVFFFSWVEFCVCVICHLCFLYVMKEILHGGGNGWICVRERERESEWERERVVVWWVYASCLRQPVSCVSSFRYMRVVHAVSYTHLDVYKRQVFEMTNDTHTKSNSWKRKN